MNGAARITLSGVTRPVRLRCGTGCCRGGTAALLGRYATISTATPPSRKRPVLQTVSPKPSGERRWPSTGPNKVTHQRLENTLLGTLLVLSLLVKGASEQGGKPQTLPDHVILPVKPNEEEEEEQLHQDLQVRRAVQRLRDLDVRLVAVDWDQTLLSIHTAGAWQGTAEELVPYVRPVMRDLLRALVLQTELEETKENGYGERPEVAVVTYSGQEDLIRRVLVLLLGAEAAERITVRAGHPLLYVQSGGWGLGKLSHIANLWNDDDEQQVLQRTRPHNHQILLIDDSATNIFWANHVGMRFVHVDLTSEGDIPEKSILADLIELE